MEELRPPNANATPRFMANNPTLFNTSTLMSVLIGLVIIILLVMLFHRAAAATTAARRRATPSGTRTPTR